MSYEILIEHRAQKEISKLPSSICARVSRAIESLSSEPRPNCKKLAGSRNEWRVRVGDYRILYVINNFAKQVAVYAVGHRRDVYR